MRDQGQRSAGLNLFLVADDESDLDAAVDCHALSAYWETRGPGASPAVGHHTSLVEALGTTGAPGALLRISGASAAIGPVLDYRRRASDDPSRLRYSVLSYRWHPDEESRDVATAFERLVDQVFAAAREVTRPHIVDHDGRSIRSIRIGMAAEIWYLERPWPNRQLLDHSTVATYRVRAEFEDDSSNQ